MSGSLRVIDITVPAARLSPQVRRDAVSLRSSEMVQAYERSDTPAVAYRATESLGLASARSADLPRFGHALDLYRQNMDARRTLSAGPLFVDTYA